MGVHELFRLGDQHSMGLASLRQRNTQLEAETETLAKDLGRLRDKYFEGPPFRHLDVDMEAFRKMKRRGYDDEGEIVTLVFALREAEQATESAAKAKDEAEEKAKICFQGAEHYSAIALRRLQPAQSMAKVLSSPSVPVTAAGSTQSSQQCHVGTEKRRVNPFLVQACHACHQPPSEGQGTLPQPRWFSSLQGAPELRRVLPPPPGLEALTCQVSSDMAATQAWGQTSAQDPSALAEAEVMNLSLKDEIAHMREKLEQRALQEEISAVRRQSRGRHQQAHESSHRVVEKYHQTLLHQEASEMRERAQQRSLHGEIFALKQRVAERQRSMFAAG